MFHRLKTSRREAQPNPTASLVDTKDSKNVNGSLILWHICESNPTQEQILRSLLLPTSVGH